LSPASHDEFLRRQVRLPASGLSRRHGRLPTGGVTAPASATHRRGHAGRHRCGTRGRRVDGRGVIGRDVAPVGQRGTDMTGNAVDAPATKVGVTFDDFARRVFNFTTSLLGLIALSPLFAVVAIAVKSDSRGPVFYRQQRVGRGGSRFDILKFRSMRMDAEAVGGQLTVGADTRITRVGRFIRAWKLDELPQLINVLVGEMDLVGPRPEVPKYVVLYDEQQRE